MGRLGEMGELGRMPVLSLPVKEDVKYPTLIGTQKPKPPKTRRRSVVWHGVRLGRRPTPFEAQVLSLETIPRTFDEEITRTTALLEADRQLQLRSLFGEEGPVSSDTMGLLADAQTRLMRFGAQEVGKELARQGLVVNLEDLVGEPRLDLVRDRLPILNQHLQLTAVTLDSAWLEDVRRSELRLRRAKRHPTTAELITFAEKRVRWGLTGAVRSVLHGAFTAGRRAAMLAVREGPIVLKRDDEEDVAALVDYVIQSAVLDTATCDPCRAIDGQVFDFESDDQQEAEPPYYDCDGGDNCRCIQIAVIGNWRDRADVEDAVDSDRVLVKTEKQAARIIRKRQS